MSKLDELRKICDEATPGPWQGFIRIGDNRVNLVGPRQFTDNRFDMNDAGFIIEARTYMPILLEIAEAVRTLAHNAESHEYCPSCNSNMSHIEELENLIYKLEE